MNELPRISIRLHGSMPAAQCVAFATTAEAAGFAGVWFAENAFARGILPAAAACAVATSRLQIGAGVFNPFSRHPTLIAMEIGALDELSHGRATLSIGSGIASATKKLEIDPQRPLVALRDTLVIVRGLLRGEEVDHAGAAYGARRVKLDYAPRAEIPILLAGRGDSMVRLAGELADGLIISNMCSLKFAGRACELMQASRRAAGRTGQAHVIQYMPCAVNADREAALRAATQAVGEMLPGFWALSQNVSSARQALLAGTELSEDEFCAVAAKLRAGAPASDVLDERFAAAFSIHGTAQECLAKAANYARAGVTELALTFAGPAALDEVRALGGALEKQQPKH
jgi:5,10-methylenetetrahydromethanopterin reductase